jgi:dipeptidase D
MFKKIQLLQPEIVWSNFYDLTQIPRPSGHERAVVEHIKNFAIQRKLEYQIDDIGNILVRKPSNRKQPGKTIILQSHVDMVPQKNNDKAHDFTRDPIETIIEGDWVRADKTTLGADNGIGVAAMLSILDSADVQHGSIEALFTVSEETGMDGVFGLKSDFLKGQILLNLDSEDERDLIIGCAGGLDADISWTYAEEKVSGGKAFKIEIKGLMGGHSGIDINLGRANANKLLLALLSILDDKCNIRISSFTGGNLRNAIPREAEALIVVSDDNVENLMELIEAFKKDSLQKFKGIETNLGITLVPYNTGITVMPANDQRNTLYALNNCPNGVIFNSPVMDAIVQTSTNLAIVRIGDGKCGAQCLLRSSVDKEKSELADKMKDIFAVTNAKVVFEGNYPGWNPNTNSIVLASAIETYKKVFKIMPEVKVIHAGLECGIIGGIYPKIDMISFGPTIRHPHSPDEKVNIKSVEKFWVFLKSLLEEI